MSRFRSSDAYGQRVKRWGQYYEISWVVDYYYRGSRLRYPRGFSRETDKKGAERFCKKWHIDMPKEAPP
jgi:hypothetical protein